MNSITSKIRGSAQLAALYLIVIRSAVKIKYYVTITTKSVDNWRFQHIIASLFTPKSRNYNLRYDTFLFYSVTWKTCFEKES